MFLSSTSLLFLFLDVCNEQFLMIGFMSLCDMPDDKFMPCEMAITEYSLRNGIIRHFHKFIDPGNMHDLQYT
jgi:hypothetical protein